MDRLFKYQLPGKDAIVLFRVEPRGLKRLKQIRKLLGTWSPCFQTCRNRSSRFSLKSELQTKTFTQPRTTICAASLQKLKIWQCLTSGDNEAAVPHLLALSDRKTAPASSSLPTALPPHLCAVAAAQNLPITMGVSVGPAVAAVDHLRGQSSELPM